MVSGSRLDKTSAGLAVQGYLVWGINAMMCRTVYAADVFEIAKNAMQKVYFDAASNNAFCDSLELF